MNRNGIDVECRDLDPASNRLQLSLPHRLISIRMRRWAAQTANLHCVGERLPRMMPDVFIIIIIIIMRRYYYYKVGTDFSDTL